MSIDFVARYPGIQNDFDLVFADTEFSRLPYPTEAMPEWSKRVTLLSVGLTALNSASYPPEFYCHRTLSKKILKECDEFVLSDVVPHLNVVETAIQFSSLSQLKRLMVKFLSNRCGSTGKVPLICVDWPGDATLLSSLSGAASRYMLLEDMPEIDAAMRTFFKSGFVRHNALHDAFAIRQGFIDFLLNGRTNQTA